MKYCNEELMRQFKNGADKGEIFELLVKNNAGALHSTAYRYSSKFPKLETEDLVSEYQLVLWDCMDTYIEGKAKFISYLMNGIVWRTQNYLRVGVKDALRHETSLNENISENGSEPIEPLALLVSPHSMFTYEKDVKSSIVNIFQRKQVKERYIKWFVQVYFYDETVMKVAEQNGVTRQRITMILRDLKSILEVELPKCGYSI